MKIKDITVTIADASGEELTPLWQLSLLLLAVRDCLALFPPDERWRLKRGLSDILLEISAGVCGRETDD